ncbi:MAG TPA: D-alanyl-D-alanine carboxypeptidase/D-alanyl-D-alanine-endopeptidase [Longimicrobiales bacterium]|nr:D-alanyl-D-alanine carboxypeptidase/D-alanyl-D-alanine-endopeptidase [Longimicrobiales bacterium]
MQAPFPGVPLDNGARPAYHPGMTSGLRLHRLAAATGVLLLSGCATLGTAPPAAAPLRQLVDSITTTPPLDRTHWGIEVWDARRGRPLARLNGDDHFVPASNQKLLVTATALEELGPQWRYRTPLLVSGAPGDSAVAELVVRGRGDPTLSARYHPTERAPLDSLADSVALAGIRAVELLVVDATWFDAALVHGTWEVGDLDYYYAAPVAAFGVAEGVIPLHRAPGPEPGAPAEVRALEPYGTAVVRSRVRTGEAGSARRWEVRRIPGTDTLLFAGALPVDAAPDTTWITPTNPAVHAAVSLRRALTDRGLRVGAVRVEQTNGDLLIPAPDAARAAPAAQPSAPAERPGPALLGEAATPSRDDYRTLAVWTSPPLSDIVAGILKPSQNWIAEHLLKTLGAERGEGGSWAAGAAVERRFLFERVGIDSSAIVIRDASGLSAQNLVTPRALVQLLEHARTRPWGAVYRAALAEPTRPGTLSRRLEALAGHVQAKTGTITHVNALSGYLTTASGEELTFSILTNASGRPAGEVRAAIDRIVEAAAREPR